MGWCPSNRYKFARFWNDGRLFPLQVDLESGKRWRYSELRIWTENCTQRLREIGVGRGNRCALICSTTAQALFVHIACTMLDAVIVSVNANLSPGQLSKLQPICYPGNYPVLICSYQ